METTDRHINQDSQKPAKGYKGLPMEGLVARWYNKLNANDPGTRSWVEKITETVPAGSRILEVAPGPGYLAVALARSGRYTVTGLDISKTFVEIAQEKAREAGVEVDFREGDAAHMPFADETFDFIVCRSAFKNFSQPVQALREMHRVLRPGGQALILDLRRDVSVDDTDAYVRQMGLNPVDAAITRWTFRNLLIKRAYTKGDMLGFVSETEFRKCRIPDDPVELQVWLEK